LADPNLFFQEQTNQLVLGEDMRSTLAFHAAHPDWPTRACFFVLTDQNPRRPAPFYQPEFAQGKMEYLIKEGYDVENHTVDHLNLHKQTPDKVQYEIALAITGIQKYLPGHPVDLLALPEGRLPKDPMLAVSGHCGSVSYHNTAVLEAAWRPVPSPVNKKYTPYRLERISPGTGLNQSYDWFKKLDAGVYAKYVSDGDPDTITVNSFAVGQVDKARLAAFGLRLRQYTGDKFD